MTRYGRTLKLIADFVGAGIGLVVLSPLLLGVAVAVRLNMGAPVIFRQVRPGLHSKPFTMFKFRTMREAYDAQGKPLPDAERLTTLGKLLRRTSIDELPQLWNVLKGEMSLVGPRPLLMEYLNRYTPEQARRHDAMPGITGWAQISGRNLVSWEQKLEHDVWYVDHWSLRLDLIILWRTVFKVLRGGGVRVSSYTPASIDGSRRDARDRRGER